MRALQRPAGRGPATVWPRSARGARAQAKAGEEELADPERRLGFPPTTVLADWLAAWAVMLLLSHRQGHRSRMAERAVGACHPHNVRAAGCARRRPDGQHR